MHFVKIFVFPLLLATTFSSDAQPEYSALITALLSETPIEEDLQELCDDIGGRLTGSKENERAVDWALEKFEQAQVTAHKHSFEMPAYWKEKSTTAFVPELDFSPLIVAKYQSPPGSYSAPLIYVGSGSEEELNSLGRSKLEGSIVLVETELCFDIDGLFAEYGHAARVESAIEKYNVSGILFMSSRPNKLLYRFFTSKRVNNTLPQFIMSREDAQRCARILQGGQELSIQIESVAEVGGQFTSHNVIAEIAGAERPNEVIIIGAHLDSWALGTGANDNGCNVSMLIDIARQISRLNIKPVRTIRFALWNGEEQGYLGSWAYTRDNLQSLNDHKMAISIDIGSGAINGFFTNGRAELMPIIDDLLKPVQGLGVFNQLNIPIVGTDNFDFMLQGVPNLVGSHKPQVYGPNYHAASDTYDKVDLKQLKVNSAIVASVVLGLANLDDQTMDELDRHDRRQVQEMIDDADLEFTMRMVNVWDSWVNGERGIKPD